MPGRERSAVWKFHTDVYKRQVLAVYASEFYAGEPCVTKNEYGQGCCYYIGTEPDEAFMAALVRYMTDAAGIAALGNADEGVELAAREKADRRWIFALNHTDLSLIHILRPMQAVLVFLWQLEAGLVDF